MFFLNILISEEVELFHIYLLSSIVRNHMPAAINYDLAVAGIG